MNAWDRSDYEARGAAATDAAQCRHDAEHRAMPEWRTEAQLRADLRGALHESLAYTRRGNRATPEMRGLIAYWREQHSASIRREAM